ncbi:BhlA/UviB family holin-like peptide [Clostridium cylindrosporum]|uniref:UviB-like protein n=1 Tax=Clostridium cylindrosporum DSM 605 TaxID=1121307 RepID=A0A0J8G192_CLOCY|nr:BhlA/UviB family holin-like peptide [Clostridium cylindrosporum]KMT21511.1 hypothetical protein CLCY_2c02720 [Clostridium cylindrosporum DSM 605]
MENVLITAIEGQGIWTICAVCLTVYVLKTSGERENRLQELISRLTEKFNIVEDVKQDVEEIKEKLK